nr:WbqC family protein [uncultured Flavobacterium sp.]
MKLGIMQPYFFPYVGYYSLIKNTDKFILFDTVQFIRHGWIERNRILKPNEGWQYIQVPLLKHNRDIFIKDLGIKNTELWREKLKAQLQHYKKRAPYYSDCMDVVTACLAIETDSIVELNYNILLHTCKYLGIYFDCEIYSKMNLTIDEVNAPDEWALNISKVMGATEYINPPGGLEFFNKEKYSQNNIKLTFLGNNCAQYKQRREGFEAGLSIIDLMMFNDVSSINNMIDDIKIVI